MNTSRTGGTVTAVGAKVQNQTQPQMSLIEKLELLLSDLDEDSPTRMFLDGGMYSVWRPREHGPRLTYIHPDDFNEEPGDVLYTGSQSWGELLYRRNYQLTNFLVSIAAICEVIHQDRIIQKSTSWAWIQHVLGIQATIVQKYSIETEVQVDEIESSSPSEIESTHDTEVQKQKKQSRSQIEDDYSKPGPSSSHLAHRYSDHNYFTRRKKRDSEAYLTEDETEGRGSKTPKYDPHSS